MGEQTRQIESCDDRTLSELKRSAHAAHRMAVKIGADGRGRIIISLRGGRDNPKESDEG